MARRGYSPEFRRRVVDLIDGGRKVSEVALELEVIEHEGDYASQWEAIRSIAEKIGCSPESLRKWLRRP